MNNTTFQDLEVYQNFKLTQQDKHPHTKADYNTAILQGEKVRFNGDCEVLAMPILIRECKTYTRFFYSPLAHNDWAGRCKAHEIKRCQACSSRVFETSEE